MTVEIISVGTEILLGNIVNTNAAYLSGKLAELGFACYYQTTVGDNAERLKDAIKIALSRADIIITSGGLGPTEDDLTKEIAAEVFEKKLIMDEKIKKDIETFFAKLDRKPTDNNWKQAMIPEGGIILENPNGTAPGVIMEKDSKKIILLPGPPMELIPMYENCVVPYLAGLMKGTIYSKTVKICGIGESKVETMIKDMLDTQTNPTIAPYAKTGEVHLRVTAKAEDDKEARKLVKPVVKELKNRFGNFIYSTQESVTLEQSVVDLLKANNLTITTAESCTGGLLAARMINCPGVSEQFKCGHVTYSNKAKRKVLGVKKTTLDKYGAVSENVAKEMAKGLSSLSKADVNVAITGIAGPDGGTEDKPVGLVYIACNVRGKITVKKYQFSGNRTLIREKSVSSALTLIRECLMEYFSTVTFGETER